MDGNSCYSEGWALGELKYVAAGEIENAYLRGELTGGDILLTDGVPAEIPMVAGVLTLAPSSGSSHVAILAQTYGVPFAHLALTADVQRAQELVGQRAVLRAYKTWEGVDTAGPCLCDATNSNERGVFRAIRRVFASFYNDNAYIERLRHGVNENDVGMAVLVHLSFPDEIEMANGVATLVKSSPTSSWRDIMFVTQLQATSVSNPTDGSIPEEVDVGVYSTSYYATLLRPSNLPALGDTVMEWQTDLYRYVEAAGAGGRRIRGGDGQEYLRA